MKIFGPADYRVQPWKNGLGSTSELASAALPNGEPGFVWRLSIADVGTDGPFSLFPHIDRVITVIEGAGMTLNAGPDEEHVLEPLKPFSFPGEWQIAGRLKAGPVRDFNLMVDRRYGKGSLLVHHFDDGLLATGKQGAMCFCHMLDGEAQVEDLVVKCHQTLLLEPDDPDVTLVGAGVALYGYVALGA